MRANTSILSQGIKLGLVCPQFNFSKMIDMTQFETQYYSNNVILTF